MLNQVMLVGRIVSEPELKKLEDGNSISNITLAIPRSYKNKDGEYDVDFIGVTLWDNMASQTAEYCKKGDIVAVRGIVESKIYEENGEKKQDLSVKAQKLSFLKSREKSESKEMDI